MVFGYGPVTTYSPATTTRSNRGFELSPRVRPSKIVMRNPPAIAVPAPLSRKYAPFQIVFTLPSAQPL